MERNEHIDSQYQSQRQIDILRFMEVSECQDYQQSQRYMVKHNFILKDALEQYINNKNKKQDRKFSTSNNTANSFSERYNLPNNLQEITLTAHQAKLFQERLRNPNKYSDNNLQINQQLMVNKKKGKVASLLSSCKNSFNCLKKVKKLFKKKLNSMKNNQQRIFYFNQIYSDELSQAQLSYQQDFIESFQLQYFEQNHKVKILNKQPIKPIFALIVPNRKNPLISNFLNNRQIIKYIRQNFEIIFLTLSELKQISLARTHTLRNISKCPTAVIYIKNFYSLEDQLIRFQGEALKDVQIQLLQNKLKQVPKLVKKWSYLINLQKHLRQNSIRSLNEVSHYYQDQYEQSSFQHQYYQNLDNQHLNHNDQDITHKKSLIQQQTQIYKQMQAIQNQRKRSIELQKQKLQQIKQLKEIRKMSIPDQPPLQQLLINKCIQFRFRCPVDGGFINRRFLKDEKVDILYQYIDTNQEIEFQTDPTRSFDLFTSFPPTSLSDKRQQLLKDIFDQQKENILIREI